MADSEKYFTKMVDGQLSVATVAQSGEIIPEESRPGDKYTTALVQTDDGPQLCVKTFDLNGGGGGGGGGSVTVDSALSTTSENPVQNKVITNALENVYTRDNLIAGTNISITEVQQPVIDDNTVELYHCNGDMIDAIANHEWTTSANKDKYIYPEGKFSKGVRKTQAYDDAGNPLNSFDYNVPATIDFWICRIDTSVYMGFKTVGGGDWDFYGTYVRANNTTINYPSGITLGVNEWHHIAIVNDGTGQSTSEKYYIDGKLAGSKANNGSFGLSAIGQGGIVDEIRVSNVARWTADFTPFSQPYQEASSDSVYQINNTQDLSSYIQNTATGNNSVTILGRPTSKNYSINLGYNSYAYEPYSVAIGGNAAAIEYSVAIGYGATVCSGKKSIQLGQGTNSTAKTFQVYSYPLLDGNTGLIPPERLGTGYDATKTQVLKHVNGVLTWVDEA